MYLFFFFLAKVYLPNLLAEYLFLSATHLFLSVIYFDENSAGKFYIMLEYVHAHALLHDSEYI